MARFRCKKCAAEVAVPRDLEPGGDGSTVRCPGCGARYRKRSSASRVGVTGGASSLAQGATTDLRADATLDSPGAAGLTAAETVADATAPPSRVYFQSGDLIASRYGIVRFVARGGMGEVYEADDLELSERVALKTVRTEGAETAGAIDRLKREIQLARRVTHPNVCRIFDVGRHQGDAETGTVTFLTMEYLEGTTLNRHLRHHGPLPPEQALPLVCQMAEALHAAHQAGIVHRDFKSENVMLVDAEGQPSRAVVTDFGIARATKDDPRDLQLTGKGVLIGTPAYMAPEQVTGGPIGPATDLYALGVVMYEMLTGRVPFLGDTALNTAALRLTTDPPSPRQWCPGLPDKWEQAILRLLERDPRRRFPDAHAVSTFLRGEEILTEEELRAMEEEKRQALAAERRRAEEARREANEVKQESRRGYRTRVLLLLLLVLSIISLVVHNVARQLEETPNVVFDLGNVAARRAVAVLQPENASGRPESDWMSVALAEMITSELSSTGQLRVIPGSNVVRAAVELELGEVAGLGAPELARLGANLGADYLVAGSFVSLPSGDLRLDLRVRDSRDGEVVATVAETGRQEQLFELVGDAGEQLRQQLRLDGTSGGARVNPLPANREAARLYAEGLEQLRSFHPLAARELLERARELEPSSAVIHSTLARAYSSLGYPVLALEAARRAFDLSAALPDQDRLAIEGEYRETAGEWERAAAVYETLWRSVPDNLDYGLKYVSACISSGRAVDALAAVDALRRLPAPASEDPRIDLAEAAASVTTSQFVRQADAARRAREKALEQGAVLLAAQAAVTEAEAQRQLGALDEARTAASEGLRLFEEREHLAGSGLALAELANVAFAAGDHDQAIELNRRSLAAFESIGDQTGVMRALNNLAVISRVQGRFDAAVARYEELLGVADSAGNRTALENGLNNLGAALFSQGRLEQARSRFQQALELSREGGQRAMEASALANLAAVSRWSGDLGGAVELYEQSLDIRREIGQRPEEVASLVQLAELARETGDLDRAAARLEAAAARLGEGDPIRPLEADLERSRGSLAATLGNADEATSLLHRSLDITDALGDRNGSDRSRLVLGRVALDHDRPEEAVRQARQVTGDLDSPAASRESLLATALLAEALAAEGRGDEALEAADAAASRLEAMPIPLVGLWVDLARARAMTSADRAEEALALLDELESRTTPLGAVDLLLRARLARIEAELEAKQPERAAAELARLLSQAQSTRHGSMVERARALERRLAE